MKPEIHQRGACSDDFPRGVDSGRAAASPVLTGEDPWAIDARFFLPFAQDFKRRRRKPDWIALAGLGPFYGEENAVTLPIDFGPSEVRNFRLSRASKEQEP